MFALARRKRKRIEDGVDGRWRRAAKSLQLRSIPREIFESALASTGRRHTERWLFLELFATLLEGRAASMEQPLQAAS